MSRLFNFVEDLIIIWSVLGFFLFVCASFDVESRKKIKTWKYIVVILSLGPLAWIISLLIPVSWKIGNCLSRIIEWMEK